MSAVDKAELQRIAQQVELNRQRMESIEQQMNRLEQIRLEQLQTIETLSAIPASGAKGAMIPLGSGVQIVADIPPETGAVIDRDRSRDYTPSHTSTHRHHQPTLAT